MSMIGHNLLQPDPILLPAELAISDALEAGTEPARVVAAHPASSLAWSALAAEASERGADVEAYAYARVGYHRGLDALRRHGWRGAGPVPWAHEPNRGFLECLFRLRDAAGAIGETDEVTRLDEFIVACDPRAEEQRAAGDR